MGGYRSAILTPMCFDDSVIANRRRKSHVEKVRVRFGHRERGTVTGDAYDTNYHKQRNNKAQTRQKGLAKNESTAAMVGKAMAKAKRVRLPKEANKALLRSTESFPGRLRYNERRDREIRWKVVTGTRYVSVPSTRAMFEIYRSRLLHCKLACCAAQRR